MHVSMFRRSLLVALTVAILVSAVPCAQVRAAYRPVSSIVLTVGSPTMVVNGFSFPVDASDASVAPLSTRGGTGRSCPSAVSSR